MVFLKRVALFILTNILVIFTINILITILTRFLGIQINPNSYSGLLMFSALMGTAGSFISLMLSKTMAKFSMGVQIIEPQTSDPQARALVELVHDLATKAKLPAMPEVGIYESPDINAFATGPSRSSSLVAVSTGLLQRMNRDEIEGVLGHEIAHIANGDMVTLALIQGIVNTFTIFLARLLAGLLSGDSENRGRNQGTRIMLTMLFDFAFSILGSLVVNYFSRLREYRADKGSAQITSREKMIRALQKLQLVYEQPYGSVEPESNEGFNAFKISGKKKSGILQLFSTHPPLEERIARLSSHRAL